MADSRLFGRVCRVIIGRPQADYRTLAPDAIEVEGLRTQFHVVRTGSKEPNTAEVSVWNLSPTHRALAQAKGSKIILLAGYEDAFRQVFAGDVRTVDQTRDGAHWITKIGAGDGERAYLYARVSESFAPGSPASVVGARLITLLGLDPGDAVDRLAAVDRAFTQGYSARGSVSRELDRLLTGLGLTWSVQDGRLQVLAPGESVRPSTSIELSPSSGLVGSPEHGSPTEKGGPGVLRAKSLLQPDLKPGVRFALVAELAKGNYVAGKTEHAGDTAGGEWYTTVEATPL